MSVPLLQDSGYAISFLALAGVYVLLALFLLKRFLDPSASKNFFSDLLIALFSLLAVLFFSYSLGWEKGEHSPFFSLVFSAVGLLPAVVFICSGKLSGPQEISPKGAATDHFHQMKEQFLSMASHELRTPLSVINGFAEVLVRGKIGPLNDEQKRRLRKILMQGQRLNRIVDELLDLSRIRSGKIEVKKEVFDLIPVLKACLEDHQVVCEQQQIDLEDLIPDVLPDVVGDLERVTQVVVNLLNNSIKYTEPGGKVSLGALYDKEKKQIRVEVKDTGIGIDPSDQPHVFEEFFRADHQFARKYSGSGLGLAIVKQFVEAQGGRVGLFSEGMGKGSDFFFTLPISKGPESSTNIKSISVGYPRPSQVRRAG